MPQLKDGPVSLAPVVGLSYAKRGMKVDVFMNDEWLPAIVVDLTETGTVIVQYVGGDERCREEVGMQSGRVRMGAGGGDDGDGGVADGARGQLR